MVDESWCVVIKWILSIVFFGYLRVIVFFGFIMDFGFGYFDCDKRYDDGFFIVIFLC